MTSTTNANAITLERTFDAPRELVFAAWTTPEHWAKWWSGGGFTTPVDSISMDVREGGRWASTMHADDGTMSVPFHGVYKEIAQPEKLVYTLLESEEATPSEASDVVSVELAEVGENKTQLIFSQSGNVPAGEERAQAEAGWSGLFDALEAHLATLKK